MASSTTSPSSPKTGGLETTYAYDQLARLTAVEPAEEAGSYYEYFGERQIKRTVHVATHANGTEAEESTFERYDPHGRLRVVEQTVAGVAHQYSRGFLTEISGWATLSYHANGALATVLHQNGAGNGAGVMDSYGLDPNDMPRPASIQLSGPSVTWNLGSYAYDGAGNVKTVGSGKFVYDELSLLKTATLANANNQTQRVTGPASPLGHRLVPRGAHRGLGRC